MVFGGRKGNSEFTQKSRATTEKMIQDPDASLSPTIYLEPKNREKTNWPHVLRQWYREKGANPSAGGGKCLWEELDQTASLRTRGPKPTKREHTEKNPKENFNQHARNEQEKGPEGGNHGTQVGLILLKKVKGQSSKGSELSTTKQTENQGRRKNATFTGRRGRSENQSCQPPDPP